MWYVKSTKDYEQLVCIKPNTDTHTNQLVTFNSIWKTNPIALIDCQQCATVLTLNTHLHLIISWTIHSKHTVYLSIVERFTDNLIQIKCFSPSCITPLVLQDRTGTRTDKNLTGTEQVCYNSNTCSLFDLVQSYLTFGYVYLNQMWW